MNILIAPNSMKGSLNANEFAAAVETGFRRISPVFNLRKVPLADGGDFTGQILRDALSARKLSTRVHDPLDRMIEADYGMAGKTAVIEMASASGLRLLSLEELDPESCTTFGTGELIAEAMGRGCRRILLGVGGSATIDGGIGMLDALGFRFFDKEGNQLPGIVPSLAKVDQIMVPDNKPDDMEIIILADVDNPLLGKQGAAEVFGPQKGAYPEMILRLEEGLENWINVLERISGRSLRDIPGMGAAGGIASGLTGLLDGRLESGALYIFGLLGLQNHLEWADWVITGEGRADLRGFEKKAPGALASLAASLDKPVSVISGSYDPQITEKFEGVFSISNGPTTLEESILSAPELISSLSQQIARLLLAAIPGLKNKHHAIMNLHKHIRLNELDKAAQILSEINDPTLSEYWYLNGQINHKIQKWGDAINNYQKCLEIDPGHPRAAAGLKMIHEILAFRHTDFLNP